VSETYEQVERERDALRVYNKRLDHELAEEVKVATRLAGDIKALREERERLERKLEATNDMYEQAIKDRNAAGGTAIEHAKELNRLRACLGAYKTLVKEAQKIKADAQNYLATETDLRALFTALDSLEKKL